MLIDEHEMLKHKLILMRHAKSDWSASGLADFDRPLSKRGRKDARRMSEWLAEQVKSPLCIISSPAQRALQTCEFVCTALHEDEYSLHYDDDLYDADIGDVLDVIKRHKKRESSLLIIGHNPAMDDVYTHLSSAAVHLSDNGKLFTTAAIATLGFDDESISLEKKSAATASILRPKELG
jgi:phosphohistidine phosphatase